MPSNRSFVAGNAKGSSTKANTLVADEAMEGGIECSNPSIDKFYQLRPEPLINPTMIKKLEAFWVLGWS